MVHAHGFSKQPRSGTGCIASLIVLDTERKQEMEMLVNARSLIIKVIEDIHRKWFFA
ncbi:MAG: hypothetical protein KBF49_07670 [Flavobacteriales bacterium]|nr:hypothetical protein [Flavobacteriales bacterium]